MNVTEKRRLLKLARGLRKVTPSRFHLARWFAFNEEEEVPEDIRYSRMTAERYLNECNTTACAMGHACVIMPTIFAREESFKALGGDEEDGGDVICIANGERNIVDGFGAAAQGFGIDEAEAECLFGFTGVWEEVDAQTITPTMVAEQIEMFLNDRKGWLEKNDPYGEFLD